jgi:hypothetical protein
MQVWSAIDPLMMMGGSFVKASQGFFACTGCCLQYK